MKLLSGVIYDCCCAPFFWYCSWLTHFSTIDMIVSSNKLLWLTLAVGLIAECCLLNPFPKKLCVEVLFSRGVRLLCTTLFYRCITILLRCRGTTTISSSFLSSFLLVEKLLSSLSLLACVAKIIELWGSWPSWCCAYGKWSRLLSRLTCRCTWCGLFFADEDDASG